jgi:2-(1,2-epoxy-1,2-dihydrophenyl)acetyl-CoA isomerase
LFAVSVAKRHAIICGGYGTTRSRSSRFTRHSTIAEIKRAPKPFVAAVDGVAAAGGFGIAMCCDLVLASERSTFEWAYGKTAFTGAESSTFFLPKLVGLRRALDLMFLSPRLDARAVRDLGWIGGPKDPARVGGTRQQGRARGWAG